MRVTANWLNLEPSIFAYPLKSQGIHGIFGRKKELDSFLPGASQQVAPIMGVTLFQTYSRASKKAMEDRFLPLFICIPENIFALSVILLHIYV